MPVVCVVSSSDVAVGVGAAPVPVSQSAIPATSRVLYSESVALYGVQYVQRDVALLAVMSTDYCVRVRCRVSV